MLDEAGLIEAFDQVLDRCLIAKIDEFFPELAPVGNVLGALSFMIDALRRDSIRFVDLAELGIARGKACVAVGSDLVDLSDSRDCIVVTSGEVLGETDRFETAVGQQGIAPDGFLAANDTGLEIAVAGGKPAPVTLGPVIVRVELDGFFILAAGEFEIALEAPVSRRSSTKGTSPGTPESDES